MKSVPLHPPKEFGMKMTSGKRWISAWVLLLGTAATSHANLLFNTSFEAESTFSYGFAQNWKLNDPDDHGDAYGSASRENWRAHDGQFLGAIRGTWAGQGDWGGFWQEAEGHGNLSYRRVGLVLRRCRLARANPGPQAGILELGPHAVAGLRGEQPVRPARGMDPPRSQRAVSPEGTEWVRVVIHAAGAGEAGALQVDTWSSWRA
jgi:hypothetical protein